MLCLTDMEDLVLGEYMRGLLAYLVGDGMGPTRYGSVTVRLTWRNQADSGPRRVAVVKAIVPLGVM